MKMRLSLVVLFTGLVGVNVSHGRNAMDMMGDNDQAEKLEVNRISDVYVLTLYSRPQPRKIVTSDRTYEQTGTHYWLDAKRLDTGRTYTVWRRYVPGDITNFPESRLRDFKFAIGEGDNIALAFSQLGLFFYEIDVSREIEPFRRVQETTPEALEAEDHSRFRLPLSDAGREKFGERGTFLATDPRRIRTVDWQDGVWTVIFTVAGKDWEFARCKDDEKWQWRILDSQEEETP